MNETLQRALLYGSAVLVIGGLTAAVAFGKQGADVATLLSSADVQLRLAYGIPAKGPDGKALPAREDMLRTAEQHLAAAERQQPGMAVTAEFRGFAHMLRGEFEQAATAYERARGCSDCAAEQRDVLAFNQARMLAKAGHRQQALDVFAQHGSALDARYGHQRAIEEAALLRELGRRQDATARLDAVLRDAAAPPMASMSAGLEYLALGHEVQAEQLLQRAAPAVPIADYHLARLKLQRGEVDTCMELLGRAASARPAEVKQRLSEDAAAWQAVTGDARYQELVGTRAAAPVR